MMNKDSKFYCFLCSVGNFFCKIGRKIKDFFKTIGRFFRTRDYEGFIKKDSTQTILSSVLCAILGIFVGFIILLCINPAHAGEAIIAILKNFFKYSSRPTMMKYYFGSTVVKAVPLILCGLSVMFSYKAGLFNIGAAGQYCIGICISLFTALYLNLPWYLCVILAMLGGALWGALSGMFKALFNVNEVIACIMTNWIALYITNIVLNNEKCMNPTLSETYRLDTKSPNSILPNIGLDKLFGGNEYATIAIPLCIIITIAVFVVLNYTTFGYELKATGYNKYAAKYAGMKDKRNIILTMAISGGLAGIAASFFYLTSIENYVISSSVPLMGFNGIAVAFLGGLNPIGIVFAGYFIEHITLGGQYVDTAYYNPQVADLIVAIIIYLCAFVLFFKQVLNKRLRKSDDKRNTEQVKKQVVSEPEVKESSSSKEVE